ncbi:chemotaxis protein CheW [Athalassotoga saccharophila]|uniref:chemotaxis protein CheW n=1 Tax=Athalassotoga saccharophila TaxID=1441386 RepID=UPI00137AE499|nr:chemotaxis protein CheW [Athalassotoga saccharophila]BBJ27783.1 chemotaxis protein CheW [Athalassotoga saccharophila]
MSEMKVVNFMIGEEEYAIDIMKIDSIVPVGKIVRIPNAPDFVEGLMDFRGVAIPVINGRKKFLVSDTSKKENQKAIVVNVGNKKVAIIVDEVKEVITLSQNQLEEPPEEISNSSNKYIGAISNMNGRMIIILDIDKILTDKESVQLANAMR